MSKDKREYSSNKYFYTTTIILDFNRLKSFGFLPAILMRAWIKLNSFNNFNNYDPHINKHKNERMLKQQT